MSNIFKSNSYVPVDETKLIEALRLVFRRPAEDGGMSPEQQAEMNEAHSLKDQILQDAESFAQEKIHQAMQESTALREQAQAEIGAWWAERRSEDERFIEEAKRTGYEQGYQEGIEQAEADVRRQYDDMLQEARSILEQAYILKQQIIQESEPFLIEMSSAIAEKIVDRQLTLEPAWTVEQIKKLLQRRKEKGTIALCVSPSQFAYIQDAREELLNAVDSQAELEILPDASVQDHGCVIRSAYGSIDARIDTQLREIKAALQEIAMRGDE